MACKGCGKNKALDKEALEKMSYEIEKELLTHARSKFK